MRPLKRLAGIGTAGLLATALWGGGTAHAMGPLARFSCDVDLTITSEWPTGYVASLRYNNTGTEPFSPWIGHFELPAGDTLGPAWNGVFATAPPIVEVRGAVWAGTGMAAGSWAEVGFVVSRAAPDGPPLNYTLNGVICTV
ncbi:cellulose binding domain-containing protein [Sphaerisporangium sp. B11E5]|uniref:cellulose binding domain-containing protein n=1 Tax=Sphaerisporangium sp. B11E5 TaxID=3153563 RepID=UPI00325E4287